MGCGAWGSGFGVWGLGFRVEHLDQIDQVGAEGGAENRHRNRVIPVSIHTDNSKANVQQ